MLWYVAIYRTLEYKLEISFVPELTLKSTNMININQNIALTPPQELFYIQTFNLERMQCAF